MLEKAVIFSTQTMEDFKIGLCILVCASAIHCVRTVPWLRYSFSDISLSVCLFTCVYTMLLALSMCLRVGAGIVGGSCEVPMIAIYS